MQFFVRGTCLIRTMRICKAIPCDVSKMTVVLFLKDITLQNTSQLISEVRKQLGSKWARGWESGGIDVTMAV